MVMVALAGLTLQRCDLHSWPASLKDARAGLMLSMAMRRLTEVE